LSIGKTRGILYKIAKFLGDFSAVSSGYPKKIAKRVGRRIAGKATGKVFRKLFSKASQRTSNKKKRRSLLIK
jgi:hypothetical protein